MSTEGNGCYHMLQYDRPRASVIIPAHNEAAVISRCITTLLHDADPDEFEIHVVSNGSDDTTSENASAALADHPSAKVSHITTASKIAALRVGDSEAQSYPRVYLDADIQMSTKTLRDLVIKLTNTEGAAVAAPKLAVDWSRSTWAVRVYHRVWMEMPYVAEGVIGAGVYAVNREGRIRIGEFPDVVNDDAYVRGKFDPHERITTAGEFISTAPVSLQALIRRRARTDHGNREIDSIVAGAGNSSSIHDLRRVVRETDVTTVHAVVYVSVTLAAKVLARIRRWRGTSGQWSMDMTSRNVVQ